MKIETEFNLSSHVINQSINLFSQLCNNNINWIPTKHYKAQWRATRTANAHLSWSLKYVKEIANGQLQNTVWVETGKTERQTCMLRRNFSNGKQIGLCIEKQTNKHNQSYKYCLYQVLVKTPFIYYWNTYRKKLEMDAFGSTFYCRYILHFFCCNF